MEALQVQDIDIGGLPPGGSLQLISAAPQLYPLKGPDEHEYQCIVPDDALVANIRTNIARAIAKFTPAILAHDGTAVIIGSGLSAANHVEDIRREKESGRPIIAVKGAHDWLIERDIVPDAAVLMDPQEKILQCVKHKSQAVCYLLASQVHPALFDWLSDCQIVLWHSWFGRVSEAVDSPMVVGGGSTSGLKALSLAYLLGFRRQVLYGFDSCIASDGTKRLDGTKANEHRFTIRAGPDGRDYLCNPAMAAQANEFQTCFEMMPGIQIKAVGEGLIPAILAERKRLGITDWRE